VESTCCPFSSESPTTRVAGADLGPAYNCLFAADASNLLQWAVHCSFISGQPAAAAASHALLLESRAAAAPKAHHICRLTLLLLSPIGDGAMAGLYAASLRPACHIDRGVVEFGMPIWPGLSRAAAAGRTHSLSP
jgi:hypothetical protein